ncbi:hypothetical protein Q2T40_11675 [Winogradskyella maritima]|nr:hypothetical protein [Winogradskyella maritima]
MKYLLLCVFGVALFNCEGRRTSYNAIKESIVEFNSENSLERINYVPKQHFERQVDSTLTNGFKVSIKSLSNDNFVELVGKSSGGITQKTRHRNSDFIIEVLKDNRMVFSSTYDRQSFFKLVNELDTSKEHLILNSINLNQEFSLSEQLVFIDVSYKNVRDNRYYDFVMRIEDNGKATIQLNHVRT